MTLFFDSCSRFPLLRAGVKPYAAHRVSIRPNVSIAADRNIVMGLICQTSVSVSLQLLVLYLQEENSGLIQNADGPGMMWMVKQLMFH